MMLKIEVFGGKTNPMEVLESLLKGSTYLCIKTGHELGYKPSVLDHKQ